MDLNVQKLTNEFIMLVTGFKKTAGTYSIGILNVHTGVTTNVRDNLDEHETWFDFKRRLFSEIFCLGRPEELSIISIACVRQLPRLNA